VETAESHGPTRPGSEVSQRIVAHTEPLTDSDDDQWFEPLETPLPFAPCAPSAGPATNVPEPVRSDITPLQPLEAGPFSPRRAAEQTTPTEATARGPSPGHLQGDAVREVTAALAHNSQNDS
jgi:hypothetical protein